MITAQRAVLSAEGLRRSFGKGETATTPLRDVSLGMAPGQVALIMGPSGSGKSTLLAVLSGLLRPDAGRVTAVGQDLWQLSSRYRERFRLRHCGFIFQGFNLLPALTARQQVEIVLRWGQALSSRESRRRADEMLSQVGLSARRHLRPHQLSGGEKQRVAIARALAKTPAVCFADEPTSSLDWMHGRGVIELLRDSAHQQGALILMVSHDARIVPYCDRVFVLDDGVLAENTRHRQPSIGSPS
jgi:putative ABC transport system ATP-binding protein